MGGVPGQRETCPAALLALEAVRDALFKRHKHLVRQGGIILYCVLKLVGTLEIYSNPFIVAVVKLVWICNAQLL